MNITGNPPPGGILPVTGAGGASVSDASGTATIKGAVADGATAVEVVVDSTSAISNASAKLLSIRNNGTEKLAVDQAGAVVFPSGVAGVVKGNLAGGSSGTDIFLDTSANRTAGNLLGVRNNGAIKLSFDFTGKMVPASVPTVKASGAAFSGSAALDSSGTVTIATTAVTATSLIFLNRSLAGGTPGTLYAAATADIVAGTSFVIRSFSSGTTAATTDTSTVQWWIVN